ERSVALGARADPPDGEGRGGGERRLGLGGRGVELLALGHAALLPFRRRVGVEQHLVARGAAGLDAGLFAAERGGGVGVGAAGGGGADRAIAVDDAGERGGHRVIVAGRDRV